MPLQILTQPNVPFCTCSSAHVNQAAPRRSQDYCVAQYGPAFVRTGGAAVSQMRKKDVRWALQRARELLERNACRYETFEGVLSRADVRALRALIGLADQFVAGDNQRGLL
jgi:hypothetical protein